MIMNNLSYIRLSTVLLLCMLAISSCVKQGVVRIMPELNISDTVITLGSEAASSFTSILHSNLGDVSVTGGADWLDVDVNNKRVIYTALFEYDGEAPRETTVQLLSGSAKVTVTVRQQSTAESDNSLRVGQLTEDGQGMIFWVDPDDNTVGKAISLQRMGGHAFETSVRAHNAVSRVNGLANTALFDSPSEEDAVAFAQSLGTGWYLPAREELWDLFDVYNGIGHNDDDFVSAIPNDLSESEIASRQVFDEMLTGLGGTVINEADGSGNGESYWSSTESEDGSQAYWVRFGKGAADLGDKTSTARFVRAMLTIGNYTFPEEPATLSADTESITLEGNTGAAATVALTSNKAEFTVTLADDSWLSYTVDESSVIFEATSRNTSGSARSTTATITAGMEPYAASVAITITQEAASGAGGELSLGTSAITLAQDAMRRSEAITMETDETDFSFTIDDPSWLTARIDAENKTIQFITLSPRLESGERSTTATIKAGASEATITITQRGAVGAEFAIGQVIPDNGSVKGGIVFWVDESDRSKAKIMSLDREKMPWTTAATPSNTGVDLSGDDGYANTQALAALPIAAEIPALAYTMGMGADWYWSARNDMEQLFETYNGTPISEASADVPDGITAYEKACRAAWDKLVTDAGGVQMNTAAGSETGDSYWVCRENSAGTKAFYVRFGKPIAWASANIGKEGERFIRGIRKVSN